MTYLLDTNVFAALAQPKPHRGVERAFTKHVGEIVTAALVVHEMWFGIERLPRSRRRTELERFMTEVVAGVRVLPYGERAAINDATVVSGNAAHFEPFEGLRVETLDAD